MNQDFVNENQTRLQCAVNAPNQFSFSNGIVLEKIEPGYGEGTLTTQPTSMNPHGMIHGGAIATLADTVAGTTACSMGTATCVTTGFTMEYLRPAYGPFLKCVARAARIGKTMSVIKVEITNSDSKTVATGTFTFYMLEKGDERLG